MKKGDFVLILLGVAFLVFFSESLYTINHRPEFMQTVYVILAKGVAEVNQTQASVDLLNKAEALSLNTNAKKYPEYNPDKYISIDLNSTNPRFRDQFKKYVSSLPFPSSSGDKTLYVARIFYKLGIIAYKTGEINLASYFLHAAVFWDPFFSYYHVELANYYLEIGDKEQAKKILIFCSNIDVTSEHCNEYLNDNLHANYPESVGFLEQRVDTFIR